MTTITLVTSTEARAMRDTRPMTRLDSTKTMYETNPVNARQTISRAFSADGQYAYGKFEDGWHVMHLPTRHEFADHFTTLPASRRWTEAHKPQPPAAENSEHDAARAAADAIKARIRRADLTDDEPENDGTSHSIDTDLAQGR